jgi:hypothetical protein
MAMRRIFISALLLVIILCACAGSGEDQPDEQKVFTVSFDYAKVSGYGSNQFAVWIEDANGAYVKTLYATRYTANGGYVSRPDSIPLWVARSGLATLSKEEVSAVTGATPKEGALAYHWDLTDAQGNDAAFGTYTFIVEVSTRGKNRAVYTGSIVIGDAAASAVAERVLFLEESPGYPALTQDAAENGMITNVTASYTPVTP